jgi:hypothetical protein
MNRTTVRAFALETLLGGALLAGAGYQHWARPGMETNFLSLAPLLFPAHLRRLLVVLGHATPAPAWVTLLEAIASAGVFVYPVSPVTALVAMVVSAALATTRGTGGAAPAWLSAAAWAALAAGAASLGQEVARGSPLALFRAAAFLPVLIEACRPARERSAGDALRRLALGLMPLGTRLAASADLLYPSLYGAAVALVELRAARAAPEERVRARRRLALRLAAPAAMMALGLFLAEVAAHVVPNSYRDTVARPKGTMHAPGETYVYEGALLGPKQAKPNVVRWNQDGWHDVDHARARPRGTVRVLVLGDSYVEGVQVATDELFHRRLGAILGEGSAPRPVEAIALGTSGWGQEQELDALRRDGLSYDPDLVLVELLMGNDIRNNDPELERLANDDAYRGTPARVLYARALNVGLFFHAFVADRLDRTLRRILGRVDPVDSDVYRAKPGISPPEAWERAWTRTGELLGELQKTCAAAHVSLVVVGFSSPLEIDAHVPGKPRSSDFDFALPGRRARALCEARGIPFIDLAERFAKLPAEQRDALHLAGDGHWAAPGHDAAARETARWLASESPVWSAVTSREGR